VDRVFADTGFLYYLIDPRTKNRERFELAKLFEDVYIGDGVKLVLTDYVFDETITRVNYDLGWRKAREIGRKMIEDPSYNIWKVTDNILTKAWADYFLKYQDKRFSFTDCTSFATMESLGIRRVATADKDFERVTKNFIVEYV
jgi:predicted nucleic acid-binding protein